MERDEVYYFGSIRSRSWKAVGSPKVSVILGRLPYVTKVSILFFFLRYLSLMVPVVQRADVKSCCRYPGDWTPNHLLLRLQRMATAVIRAVLCLVLPCSVSHPNYMLLLPKVT